MRRSEKLYQHAFFFLNLKSTICRIIRSKLFFISRINQSFHKKISRIFTKTISFLNSKFNQRFSFQRTYDRLLSNKCLYCYRKNHIFKRDCSNFQNDMFNNRIHMYEKRIYLEFQRDETLHVHIWIERNQRDCVIISKKFNEMIFSQSSIFVQFRAIFQMTFLIVLQFNFKSVVFAEKNVNTINIKNKTVEKLFTNEKYDFEIVIMNHICMNVVVLFVVAAQNISKKNEKTIKTIKKRILNKKIEKKNCQFLKFCVQKNEKKNCEK